MARVPFSSSKSIVRTVDFLATLPLASYKASDGRLMGEEIMLTVKRVRADKSAPSDHLSIMTEVDAFLSSLDGMNTFLALVPAFGPLLHSVLHNRLYFFVGDMTKIHLNNLPGSQGSSVGNSLPFQLFCSIESEDGVEEWITACPALSELDSNYCWFRPMFEVIAQQLLAESLWGSSLRLCAGGAMTILDTSSDIYMTVFYFTAGAQVGFGWTMLTLILTCLSLQLLGSIVNNRKMRKCDILMDAILVFTSFKPAVAAYVMTKYGGNKKQHKKKMLNNKVELVFFKLIVLFAGKCGAANNNCDNC
jgi:hypothetical protein